MTIFFSHAIGDERLGIGLDDIPREAGRERWRHLADLYRASLDECGIDCESVVRPEIYQTEIARGLLGIRSGDWHLAVKPVGHQRPFHGMPNVFVCDGRYDEREWLPEGPSAFPDPTSILKHADVVLCTTEGTARSFQAAGIEHAIVLSPHVPVPILSTSRDVERSCRDRNVRFGAWIDSETTPDEFVSMIEAFVEANRRHAGLRLVVNTPPGRSPSNFEGGPARRFGADAAAAISFISQASGAPLEDDALTGVEFVLRSDPADRFSTPLAKATLCGIPSVTITGTDAVAALLEAATMDIAVWRDMGERARVDAGRRLGPDAFAAGIRELERQFRHGLS